MYQTLYCQNLYCNNQSTTNTMAAATDFCQLFFLFSHFLSFALSSLFLCATVKMVRNFRHEMQINSDKIYRREIRSICELIWKLWMFFIYTI